MSLNKQMEVMLPAIEAELQKQVARLDDTATRQFHEMLTYHMGWTGEGAGSEARGKRIRPLLVILTAASCNHLDCPVCAHDKELIKCSLAALWVGCLHVGGEAIAYRSELIAARIVLQGSLIIGSKLGTAYETIQPDLFCFNNQIHLRELGRQLHLHLVQDLVMQQCSRSQVTRACHQGQRDERKDD